MFFKALLSDNAVEKVYQKLQVITAAKTNLELFIYLSTE